MAAEPLATALLLSTLGLLLGASVLSSRATERFRVPVTLVFLAVGMLAGSDGLGGIPFEDYSAAFRFGTVALVLILFDGGLNTSLRAVRRAAGPAALLATVGVLVTAGCVALVARAVGLSWPMAGLVGAVVSSTDAAAVFAVLRGSRLNLKRRVGATLEVESGLNDPMAVMLTTVLTGAVAAGALPPWWALLGRVVAELAIGAAVGGAVGWGVASLLRRVLLVGSGLYPVLTVATALLAFGIPVVLGGSGFLGVYVAAVVLGDAELPYRETILRVHDALAWLSQISMFLLLGLLVFPSRLADVAVTGLVLAAALALVARPVSVLACLAPFREFRPRERVYVAWVGLRGATPIILATVPVVAGVPGAERLFDLVFVVVVAGSLVPGATVAWVTRRLALAETAPAPPRATLSLESREPLDGLLLGFAIHPEVAVAGSRVADLPLPDGSAVTLILRGRHLVPATPDVVLLGGDHVYVATRADDRAVVELLFGRAEAD